MKVFKIMNTLSLALLMSLCQGGVAQTSGENVPNYRDQVQIMYVAYNRRLLDSFAELLAQTMYVTYYGRPGDAGGLDFWAGKLEEADGDLMEIIDSFGNSMEFTERFGDLDNEELVNNIFLQLLGRDADSEGLNFYLNGLRVGRYTLASIALNVANGTKRNPLGRDNKNIANKLRAANAFTETYAEAGADYGEFQIDDAKLWLAEVDSTAASVTAALDRLPDLLEMFSGGTQPDLEVGPPVMVTVEEVSGPSDLVVGSPTLGAGNSAGVSGPPDPVVGSTTESDGNSAEVAEPGRPNLQVGSPSLLDDTSLETGASFWLLVTVRNTGDGESAATTLRYYRSNDSTITSSDMAVGVDPVTTLAASGGSGESSGESILLTAPSVAGTYYYGACVDAVTDETDTVDNCSASLQVTVSDGGRPAVEVHLFAPDGVEEHAGYATLVVVAWTKGDRAPTVSISVRVWLVAGTAEEAVDFDSFTQLVEFNVADFTFTGSRYEAKKDFTITILDDTETEGDETFAAAMTLEHAQPFVTLIPNYPDQHGITILANDGAGQNAVEVTAP